MTRIEELIQQLCPDGVENKALWEVTIWDKKFNSVDRSKQSQVINYPYLLASELFLLEQEKGNVFLLSTGEQTGWTTEELAGDYLCEGEIVSIPWGKSRAVSEVLKYYNGKFVTADNRIATSIDIKLLLNKFLYYWMLSQGKIIDSFYRGSGIKHPNMNDVLAMQIPVPPLPIQKEIVSILDKFTQMEVELEAELEARKKQYDYYRNELMNFEGKEVEWKTLGEVCLKNENIKWKENQNIDYQYIDLSSVNRDNNKISETQTINSTNAPSRAQQIVKKDDVIFGTTRPTLKRYSLINSEYHNQICSTGFCVLRANKEILLPKFLFYVLTTKDYYNYVENNQEGAGYPSISNSTVKRFPIPIPSLAEQERVVGILDKFDALVNDITEGLPAEIEARRKQYEYYRWKLLDFKSLNH